MFVKLTDVTGAHHDRRGTRQPFIQACSIFSHALRLYYVEFIDLLVTVLPLNHQAQRDLSGGRF